MAANSPMAIGMMRGGLDGTNTFGYGDDTVASQISKRTNVCDVELVADDRSPGGNHLNPNHPTAHARDSAGSHAKLKHQLHPTLPQSQSSLASIWSAMQGKSGKKKQQKLKAINNHEFRIRVIWTVSIVTGIYFLMGFLYGTLRQKWTFIDSVYFIIVTMTTVGLNESF